MTTYGYDLSGNVLRKMLPNGVTTFTTYDSMNRKLQVDDVLVATSTRLSFFNYSLSTASDLPSGYDKVGNLLKISEEYATSGAYHVNNRIVVNSYDHANRLATENQVEAGSSINTTYAYDKANNRTGKLKVTSYGTMTSSEDLVFTYGDGTASTGANSNQLTGYGPRNAAQTHTFTYDANGNRATHAYVALGRSDTYSYDYENRLVTLDYQAPNDPNLRGNQVYAYDHLTRRVVRDESAVSGRVVTNVSFSGSLSVQERTGISDTITRQYIRGSDWGGGVGGILYSYDSSYTFNHYNSRGDVIGQTGLSGAISWQASYEAFGTRVEESGSAVSRQKANTKDEDPTGLLNEGMRYRDLEAGVFITRDPSGFVDGPNVYTYVKQNPWSGFDPDGQWALFDDLAAMATGAVIGVGAQAVSDLVTGHQSNWKDYAAAAIGGAAAGEAALYTGGIASGAVGGAAQSAARQYLENGNVSDINGAEVAKAAALGAVGGKLGEAAGSLVGCGAGMVTKAAAGATTGAAAAAGTQMVANVMDGNDITAGVADAAKVGAITGAVGGMMAQTNSCFVPGTLVLTLRGELPIEEVRCGQRVISGLYRSGVPPPQESKIDPASWRLVNVRLEDAATGWDVFDITLLRPLDWIADHSCQDGKKVWLEIDELSVRGWAEVTSVDACPEIEQGEGRVVTATVSHFNDDVRQLALSSGETLEVTGRHRLWSSTRQDWVKVMDLTVGETLATRDGDVTVVSLTCKPGRYKVHNLEVDADHCYLAGSSNVLSHNNCTEGSTGKEVANKADQTHVTYTKIGPDGEVYSGRSRGPSTMAPEEIVARRDANHHMNDKGFAPSKLDKSSKNAAAIRGREQQLIEANGGAQSTGGTSGNAINGISAKNPKGSFYRSEADREFGGGS